MPHHALLYYFHKWKAGPLWRHKFTFISCGDPWHLSRLRDPLIGRTNGCRRSRDRPSVGKTRRGLVCHPVSQSAGERRVKRGVTEESLLSEHGRNLAENIWLPLGFSFFFFSPPHLLLLLLLLLHILLRRCVCFLLTLRRSRGGITEEKKSVFPTDGVFQQVRRVVCVLCARTRARRRVHGLSVGLQLMHFGDEPQVAVEKSRRCFKKFPTWIACKTKMGEKKMTTSVNCVSVSFNYN